MHWRWRGNCGAGRGPVELNFEGLEEVRWSELFHAHGEASDIPGLLDRICSAETTTRGEACAELFETVWHQGTIYPASSAILPFLFQIIDQKHLFASDVINGNYIPRSDEMAVALICSVVTGDGWLQKLQHIADQDAFRARLEALARSYDHELELEQRTIQKIRATAHGRQNALKDYLRAPEGLGEIVAKALDILGP